MPKIVAGTETLRSIITTDRLGEPEATACCVSFSASDDAYFISTSTISVNAAQFFG